MRAKTAGVLAVLGASFMWSWEPILAKIAFRSFDVRSVFAARVAFSLLVITGYCAFKRLQPWHVPRRMVGPLIYISLGATLCADLVYTIALTRVPVINAVLIAHLQPVFIAVMGIFFLKGDRLTRNDLLGIALMMAAGLLVVGRTTGAIARLQVGTTGDLLVLGATAVWATTSVVTRRYLASLDAGTIAFYRFSLGGLVYLASTLIRHGMPQIGIAQVALGVVIGIGTILYYEGLVRIKAAQVAAVELSTPFFATLLGVFLLREYITTLQACGMILLAGGLLFLSRAEPSGMSVDKTANAVILPQ